MAYPITDEARRSFAASHRQRVRITFNGTEQTLNLTEANILTGGLSVNRHCVSGKGVEIGSVVAAELKLMLDNSEGQFDDVVFEGGELYVRIGVKDQNNSSAPIHWVPFGYFTVDNAPRKLKAISLTALDRMVLFDKPVNSSLLTFPMSVSALITRVCNICNVTLETDTSTLTNHNYTIETAPPDENLTYRQYLSWLSEITGTCAFIDWQGKLILKWYTNTEFTIEPSDRFDSDLQENNITITGVQVCNRNDVYLAGQDGYVLNIESNPLIQHDYDAVALSLFQRLNNLSYTPFTATVLPMPHLYPLDIVSFADKNGTSHPAIVTDTTFLLNGNTLLEGKGETTVNRGYAAANPLTNRERAIIQALINAQNETLNPRIQSALAFNELISNALGLYVTPREQEDGSTIYYIHDRAKLEESLVIFTMTAGGIAWTNTGWNDGNPVWFYGVTSAGDALFRMLSAEGIEVSKVGEDYYIKISPSAFEIYYKNMLVTKIEADSMTIPKATFTDYIECGKIQLRPYIVNGVVQGTNIVFLD